VQGASAENRSLGSGDRVILHVPVRGYLRFLPAIFQGEGPVTQRIPSRARDTALARWGSGLPEEAAVNVEVDEDPLRRFLFLFQHIQTRVTDRIDRMAELIDPLMCEPHFLPWLASWVGFELDESLPVHQQRELVRRAIRLYRNRGTRHGIEEMVRVLTAAPVGVRERQMPPPAALGKALVIGGRNVVERHQRNEPLGCYLYDPSLKKPTSFFNLTLEPRERFDARFGERAPGVLRRIVHVVSQEAPVHISFVIQFDQRG
jgi:phage tail-like protein